MSEESAKNVGQQNNEDKSAEIDLHTGRVIDT